MNILAIETSCDDTCITILKIKNQKFKILSNVVSSQVKLHAKYGGIYPFLAKREHQKNLVPVLKKSLLKARLLKKLKVKNEKLKIKIQNLKLKEILKKEEVLYKKLKKFLLNYQKPKIDLIAVTIGPGLEPCLWQGVNFAKTIAYLWDLPIIPTNHIEGHIIANWLKPISSKSKIKNQKSKIQLKIKKLLPAICLVVSGGHTQLILMKDIGKYKIIGETRDDAAGECFDKTARILGIGYPGGPAIAKMATKYKMPTVRPLFAHCSHTAHSTQQDTKYKIQDTKYKIHLPRPMIYQKNYDFSFSGLKTAVLYDFKKQSSKVRKSKEYIKEMCSEIQQAVIDVLIYKTLKAVKDFKVKTIILGGGVAANEELRKQFNYQLKTINYKLKFLVPPKIFCTDNAAMIAVVAYFRWQKGETKNWEDIKTNANLRIS